MKLRFGVLISCFCSLSFLACDAEESDAPGDGDGGGSTTGGPSTSTTGGEACTNGDVEACYEGPDGTLGVGSCKGGYRTCGEGAWGPCTGAVLPATDACNGIDDDCSGAIDEGCACSPGEVGECYSGSAQNAGVGACIMGSQTCESGSFGECLGSVLPVDEICGDRIDQNCDGLVDGGGDCDTGLLGSCANGAYDCDSNDQLVCYVSVGPSPEGCNASDEDCNGVVNDACLLDAMTTSYSLTQRAIVSGNKLFTTGWTLYSGTDWVIARSASTGTFDWGHNFPSGAGASDLALDATGEVWVVGGFDASFAIDAATLASVGAQDGFILRLSATGDGEWGKVIGGAGDEIVEQIEVLAGGDLIVAGTFEEAVDFGSGAISAVGGRDVFVARYTPSGSLVAISTFGTSGFDTLSAMDVSPTGDVWVGGGFNGTMQVGATQLVSSSADGFLVKLDASLSPTFTKTISSSSSDDVEALDVDASGQVTVAGTLSAAADLGGGSIGSTYGQLFVLRLDASGSHIWSLASTDVDGEGQAFANEVLVDPAGDVWIAGSMEGTVDFGLGAFSSNGGRDILLAKISSTGTTSLARAMGNGSNMIQAGDFGSAIALLSNGELWLAGRFAFGFDAGGGAVLDTPDPRHNYDGFWLWLDP